MLSVSSSTPAVRKGMHYGIYISPWDRHEQTYGDSPKYNQYFLNQKF